MTMEGLFDGVNISEEVLQNLVKGKVLPTKNLLFSVALSAHLSLDDTQMLMTACDMEWDYALQRDVVVRYLLERSIYNEEMVSVALKEYKINHLFLK